MITAAGFFIYVAALHMLWGVNKNAGIWMLGAGVMLMLS